MPRTYDVWREIPTAIGDYPHLIPSLLAQLLNKAGYMWIYWEVIGSFWVLSSVSHISSSWRSYSRWLSSRQMWMQSIFLSRCCSNNALYFSCRGPGASAGRIYSSQSYLYWKIDSFEFSMASLTSIRTCTGLVATFFQQDVFAACFQLVEKSCWARHTSCFNILLSSWNSTIS